MFHAISSVINELPMPSLPTHSEVTSHLLNNTQYKSLLFHYCNVFLNLYNTSHSSSHLVAIPVWEPRA